MDSLTYDIDEQSAPPGGQLKVIARIDVPSITLEGSYVMEVHKGHAEGTEEDVLLGNGDYTIQVVDMFLTVDAVGRVSETGDTATVDKLTLDLGLHFKTINGGSNASLNGGQVQWADAAKAFNDGFASLWNEGRKGELNEAIRCSVNFLSGGCDEGADPGCLEEGFDRCFEGVGDGDNKSSSTMLQYSLTLLLLLLPLYTVVAVLA
jgi:hypothetical protein